MAVCIGDIGAGMCCCVNILLHKLNDYVLVISARLAEEPQLPPRSRAADLVQL